MGSSRVVAVIGLGSMGLGMARSLIRSGHRVLGYDLNAAALEKLVKSGGAACQNPAATARDADVLLVVVVNATQTQSVLFGPNGAVAAMKPGSVVISSATMLPAEAQKFATLAYESDVLYLDAPVSGGMGKAEAGELTIMASGSAAAFSAAQPVLDAMAQTIYALGDDVGIGSSFKIVNQLLAGVHIAAACEAITFAKRLGLDISKVFEVLTKSAGNSWMFEDRIPHILKGDYTSRSAVSIFTKDLGIVSDLSRKQSFPLPVANAALQLFLMTEAAGMGSDDDASVARLLAQISGIDLPKGEKSA